MRMARRSRSTTPFVVIGSISIVLGGAVSAASAPSPSYTASWAVAYVVLVAGMAQLALGLGQARLAVKQPSATMIAAEVITLNVANIAVLVGTIMIWTILTDVGGGLFIIALALFVWAVRAAHAHNKWMLYGFRVVIAICIVTTPIGLVIASVRAG